MRRFVVAASFALLVNACVSTPARPAASPPPVAPMAAPVAAPRLRTLIVSGGPDRTHNQVAIESNVRYLSRLLPLRQPYHVLFADGSLKTDDVQVRAGGGRLGYRRPDLPRLDGPSETSSVRSEIDAMAADAQNTPSLPVLLYFTGHGTPNVRSRYADNGYDLWGGRQFTVHELAAAIDAFPAATPVTLVMVQCYSGAFGNVLFKDGKPDGAVVDRRLAGFFAAAATRVAAGCTSEINEAVYRDFTGYFFAALSGVDRLGAAVTGADFDRDGRVSMHEAFIYTLLNDPSIDTPVATSDTFLRRFVSVPDEEVFGHPYADVRGWADPAQRAALDGLSKLLTLDGEGRLHTAFTRSRAIRPASTTPVQARVVRFIELARTVVLAHTLMSSTDEPTQARFTSLLKDEGGNPLKSAGGE